MHKCSVCENEFEDDYFDIDQQKCILHCEKNQHNGWYQINEKNQKVWDGKKVNIFWSYIQNDLDRKYSSYLIDSELIDSKFDLENTIFPKFQDDVKYYSVANNENELGTNFYSFKVFEDPIGREMEKINTLFSKLIVSFNSCLFLDDANFEKYDFEQPLLFNKCTFKNEIHLNAIYNNRVSFLDCTILNLNCKDIIFEQKVKIQNCTINGECNFYNTSFKKLADFYRTNFNEVIFTRTDFEAVVVFSEAVFHKDVNFKYTKFLGYSVFRDTVIKGKLDLRNTIFDSNADANFLDITSEERPRDKETQEFYGEPKVIQVANRETARLIKSFYEYSNNIIESNKFYALEMKEREKELEKSFKDRKNLIEWAIFKLHGLSSNHSQDPVAPILWILNIAFIYSMWISGLHLDNILGHFAVFIAFIGILSKNKFFYKAILFGNLILPASASFITLAIIADKINPFSIMTSKDPITFGLLLFKITIAYLIYQFIVSVRQNTRRK